LSRGIAAALECDAVTIHLVHPDEAAPTPVAALVVQAGPVAGLVSEALIALAQPFVAWCLTNDRALLVPDVVRDPRNQGSRMPLGVPDVSMLTSPIRDEGAPAGVVAAYRSGIGRFGESELVLLESLAEFAGRAITRARQHAERDRLVDRLRVLLEIQEAAATAVDDRALAELLVSRLAEVTRMDACVISRWDEATTTLRTLAWHGQPDPGRDQRPAAVMELPHTREVLLDGVPVVLRADAPDVDPGWRGVMAEMGARAMVLMPLVAVDKTIGLLELYEAGRGAALGPDLELCTTIAHHVGGALENASLVGQLRQAADVDQLTGVATHRHLQERVRHEIARSARAGTQFSVLMVDLDGFKGVNDRHGHADGNRVLRNVAAGIKLAVRASDIVARYGGDEFVVLMPDTGERAARVVARRVVTGVSGQRHQLADGSVARLTCSVGLAVYPEDGRTAATLLKSADLAMYEVKGAGGRDVRRGSADRSPSVRVPVLPLKGR
jgi:diguanylate cyclase (GGDEF)-like protein